LVDLYPELKYQQPKKCTGTLNEGRVIIRVKLTKGTILAHRRKGAGIEQTTLAAALGISASALCKMEKGQREHDWTRFDTAHEMIERLERGEPVPVREEASDE
jgi:DNA-binding XRE family transcriptional regulator